MTKTMNNCPTCNNTGIFISSPYAMIIYKCKNNHMWSNQIGNIKIIKQADNA